MLYQIGNVQFTPGGLNPHEVSRETAADFAVVMADTMNTDMGMAVRMILPESPGMEETIQ